ncbi:MAG: sugar ABC transporter permease [bacterium]|nr:sugar ABC transporter permease [bacterium]MCM1376424.1 sugar ABC transporter permease [Muribaculum sp.]
MKNISRAVRRGGSRGLWFLAPSLLGVGYLVLLPTGDVLRRSFTTALSGQWVGLNNYCEVLDNEAFRLAVRNTLRFLALSLPLLLSLSLLLALMICRIPRLERFKALYLLPMAIPAATVVLVWRLVFSEQGFLNAWRGTHVDFMGESTSLAILVGSYIWKNLGYTMVLWLAGLKAIPAEQTEAARVDGAGRIRCFFQITLPNLKGSAYTITLLSLLNAFKSFREAYLVSGAYPQQDIYLLQHLFQNWYTKLDMDKLAAGAVLMALVLGALSLLLQKLWNTEASL